MKPLILEARRLLEKEHKLRSRIYGTAADVATAKAQSTGGADTFQGKKGVWRTMKSGTHIFVPDDGSGLEISKKPALNKKIQAALPDTDFDHDTGKGVDTIKSKAKVTHANWKDKWKAIAHAVGHSLVHPFVMVKDLLTKPAYRTEVKDFLKGAVKKEVGQTKKMAATLGRVLRGEKISPEDKRQAIHQAADLVKVAVTGALVAHLAAGGVGHLLATMASPADEVAAMALDGPVRHATTKVFGVEHGLLPSSFYESVDSPEALMDKIFDAILDELAKGAES